MRDTSECDRSSLTAACLAFIAVPRSNGITQKLNFSSMQCSTCNSDSSSPFFDRLHQKPGKSDKVPPRCLAIPIRFCGLEDSNVMRSCLKHASGLWWRLRVAAAASQQPVGVHRFIRGILCCERRALSNAILCTLSLAIDPHDESILRCSGILLAQQNTHI